MNKAPGVAQERMAGLSRTLDARWPRWHDMTTTEAVQGRRKTALIMDTSLAIWFRSTDYLYAIIPPLDSPWGWATINMILPILLAQRVMGTVRL